MAIDAAQADSPPRSRFWQFQPAGEYLAAVCAERARAEPTQLQMRKVVPLAGEEILD